ncbi:hypothetical protein BC827DRAFT_804277 [Russula dissimulans]|nr:hypothetical protein BC827DRAFT_804277 [Russula dissimulans]
MLTKSFITSIFLLAFTSSVHAHAGVSPALGVKGDSLQRQDVQRPDQKNPCGTVDIAKNLDSSTPIQANADGTFSGIVTDFNPGPDGSRFIKTAEVDPSGTGQNFSSKATVLTNGDPNPKNVSSEKITAMLPPGTQCEGGTNKNLCLVSFTTSAGFGNCAVVAQGGGAAKRETSTDSANPARNGAAKGTPSDKNATKGKHSDKHATKGKHSDKNAAPGKQLDKSPPQGKHSGKDATKGKQLDKSPPQGKHSGKDATKGKHSGKDKPQTKASNNDKSQHDPTPRMTLEQRYNPFRNGAAKGVPLAGHEARQVNPPARRMVPRRHWSSRS